MGRVMKAVIFPGVFALVVVTSGCFGFFSCHEPTSWFAAWNQADLYEALPENSTKDPQAFNPSGRAALPFQHPTLDARWGEPTRGYLPGEYGLLSVHWTGHLTDDDDGLNVWGHTPGHDTGQRLEFYMLAHPISDEEAGRLFVSFAQNVTNGTEQEIDGWRQQLLATRLDSGGGFNGRATSRFQTEVIASIDAAPLYDRLLGTQIREHHASVGHVDQYVEDWRFQFSLRHKRIEGLNETDAFRLSVDVGGFANYYPRTAYVTDEEAYQELSDRLESLNVTVPPRGDVKIRAHC